MQEELNRKVKEHKLKYYDWVYLPIEIQRNHIYKLSVHSKLVAIHEIES